VARVLAVGCQQRRQRPFCYEYYTGVAARLTTASIPEDLTDNELDEVLNAKTSFNKRVRPTKYSRWVTRNLEDQRWYP
jgi:hypothetical protein